MDKNNRIVAHIYHLSHNFSGITSYRNQYSLDQVWFGLTACQALREKAHSEKDYIEYHCKLNCCGKYTAAFLAAHTQVACVKFHAAWKSVVCE